MPAARDPFADNPLLEAMLPLAVLVELSNAARLTTTDRQRLAAEAADMIGAHGDDLQFGGRHCASTSPPSPAASPSWHTSRAE